ncbi:histidinol-phosphatase HisJ family protein [Oscillospiraceae bacterium MB08-C2-2]|nr:histidinol-phosphatase HisJ family protein [Oscillospiraceae bacterium MB08-C2-2]
MRTPKLYDSHTHSYHSPDGHDSVFQLCQSALDRGLSGIAITDHYENDVPSGDEEQRCRESAANIRQAKEIFRKRLDISVGMEMGQGPSDTQRAAAIVDELRPDVVLGSIHHLNGPHDEIYHTNFAGVSAAYVNQFMHDYFRKVYEVVEWGNFDVLSHITMPHRYLVSIFKVHVDLARYEEDIEEILKLCAQKGKAIEINTSGLRTDHKEFMPLARHVKRFHELGGEVVTLGSDAHYMEHVGEGLTPALDVLREAGFKYYGFFKERKPVMIPLLSF